MYSNRRQFDRLDITDEAIALDATGRRLGRVVRAGGGGMTVVLDAEIEYTKFAAGDSLRITVLEPARQIRHALDTSIRYVTDGNMGLEFVSFQS
jgi:hypothetical protein